MINHGPYQLFAALDPATEAALRASISRWGVIVPVVTDQHGNILDGHHRSRIAQQLGLDYPSTVMVVDDKEQAEDIARTLNTDRRHLTVEQRRVIVTDLRSQGFSTRAIAGAVGVSKSTVHDDLSGVQNRTPEPERIVGVDGKTYAPTQPARPAQPEATPAQPATRPAVLFTLEEQALLERLTAGETVVLNMRDAAHGRLWAHAENLGLAVRIDRKSEWGNPFLVDIDGDRDQVCDWYANAYWPLKASLQRQVHNLNGKALGCWCAPERCHGDHLKREAEA